MAGTDNLIPFNKLTEKQQREIASNGGKKSAEVKKKRKREKEVLEMLLSCKAPENLVDSIKKDFPDVDIETIHDLGTMRVIKKWIAKGDVQAYNAIMDRKEGKPMQKSENKHVIDMTVRPETEKEREIREQYEKQLIENT